AARVGIPVPEASRKETDKEDKDREQRRLLRLVTTAVEKIYCDSLMSSNDSSGAQYLRSRELSSEIIERYRLGFAPANWDFILPAAVSELSKNTQTPLPEE